MTTMTFRTTIPARRLAALCLVAAAIASASARAQTWPERPITLVSQGAPGGSTDRIKTIVFDRVAIALGKPMVLDSRPGAAGTIAAGYTARAAPDGYTLFLGTSGSLTAAPTVQKNVPYDTLRDFTPITTLIENSLALVVGRSVSARDARELVEAMRREPGRYNYGSWGLGSGNFLAFELFKLMTGTDAVHVPYKGAAPLLQAMLAGDVQVAFMDLPALRPHVEAGTLRILGLAAQGRDPTLPDLPTLTEQGLPIVAGGYFFLVGPAGIPDAIANRLNAEVLRALAEPEVRRQLLDIGNVPFGDTRRESAERLASELAKWKRVADAIGYQPQ